MTSIDFQCCCFICHIQIVPKELYSKWLVGRHAYKAQCIDLSWLIVIKLIAEYTTGNENFTFSTSSQWTCLRKYSDFCFTRFLNKMKICLNQTHSYFYGIRSNAFISYVNPTTVWIRHILAFMTSDQMLVKPV